MLTTMDETGGLGDGDLPFGIGSQAAVALGRGELIGLGGIGS